MQFIQASFFSALVYPGVYSLGDQVAKLGIKARACVYDETLYFFSVVSVIAKVGF
jgi:hypothetical protein